MNNELAKLIPNDISKITVITLLELLMKFGTPKEDIRIALSIIQGVHSASHNSLQNIFSCQHLGKASIVFIFMKCFKHKL